MTTSPPVVRIFEPEMRRRFNDGRYWERVESGELHTEEWDSRHPSLPTANEPYCTRSLMLAYLDQDGNEIARVHQYLRPDGTIGASGRPDPKRLFENGVLYRLVKQRDRVQRASSMPAASSEITNDSSSTASPTGTDDEPKGDK